MNVQSEIARLFQHMSEFDQPPSERALIVHKSLLDAVGEDALLDEARKYGFTAVRASKAIPQS